MTPKNKAETCDIRYSCPEGGTLLLALAGPWKSGAPMPKAAGVVQRAASEPGVRKIAFDCEGMTEWDSGLLTFIIRLDKCCGEAGLALDTGDLPAGAGRLLTLAAAVPPKKTGKGESAPPSFLAQVGASSLALWDSAIEMIRFIGEATVSLGRLFSGRARFRRSDLFLFIQETGAQALPIVTLISLLVGLILAFVGAVQLQMFGAQIYVANLVGLGMAREMGAMMSAIIMAGRTGSAFAAQLGTMQVNEEIDALTTLGISPMEFLVLPRMIALALMMPLLCVYANLMGIAGGLLVGVGMLDISFLQYLSQTAEAVTLTDFAIGIVKSGIFGVLIALAGCLRGIRCGRSASAVGIATTSAVVTAIVFIIVSDSLITVICSIIGI